MTFDDKIKCDYCPTLLSNKANKLTHMNTNKSCLKKRGILSAVLFKSCLKCGFNSNNHILGHICRPESINMVNKIKLLHTDIDKINCDVKVYKDIISDNNNKYKQLEIKLEKSESKYKNNIEKHNKEIFNLERNTSLIINELKAELKEYKNKIFDIASKPSVVNNNTEYYTESSNIVIEEIDDLDEDNKINNDDYQLTPLELGNGYNI